MRPRGLLWEVGCDMRIVLDPGHGGTDPGAVGPTGLQESEVVLDVARRARNMLIDSWHACRLTREKDVFVTLGGRAQFANQHEADLFVSIHCNAFLKPAANGTETWHFQGSGQGARLAAALQKAMITRLGRFDRGVKQTTGFAVLRYTAMPAALVEIAFISNPEEEAELRKDEVRTLAARAIADGIQEYVRGVV